MHSPGTPPNRPSARSLLLISVLAGLHLLEEGPASAAVVINEIHCSPKDVTIREEFVELYNDGDGPVDLSGWSFTAGIRFVFPAGTSLAGGEYLAVAQDPAVLKKLYPDASMVGPFSGQLSSAGERLVLRDAGGHLQNEVTYGRGFPWPSAGGTQGYSLELVHPGLNNELAGSWRLSSPEAALALNGLLPSGVWKYLEGTAEASTPPSAWRAPAFDDSTWKEGPASIGFGKSFVKTVLDMRGKYACFFLRREFQVDDPASVEALRLDAQFDDGFNAWINGVHVAGANVPADEMAFGDLASSSREVTAFQSFVLPPPAGYLVAGRNVLAVQVHNSALNGNDAYFDGRLALSNAAPQGPTPGARNSVYSTRLPPRLLSVSHSPVEPTSGTPVVITARIAGSDEATAVTLHYQVVDPGKYIRLKDPAYATEWTSLDMLDDGKGADEHRGDGVWTVALPPDLAVHRRLVRYRITAADAGGLSVTVPYPDDPQPNFAFFVYDGVPAWKGKKRPGTPVLEFDESVMRSLPVYHLIARQDDVMNCQYNPSFETIHFQGTMVYEGQVYDHIGYEIRGEFSTYVSGKNKWRFHFLRGHDFRARDDWGRRYLTTWREMNFSGCASPWVPSNRGMAGLDEAVAFKLFGLAGGPSPKTNWLQFRVIDESIEAHPTDQYRGDLWGLYMTIEHSDGRFLQEHGLPDGNTYKIKNSAGEKRNQGPTQPKGSVDYDALRSGYERTENINWWRSNVDLFGYYGFRSVGRAINDMDLREGWNVCQYHNPQTNLWSVMPWDEDMLYMPVTHWPGVMDFQNAMIQQPALMTEYRNRARELIDLLFTPDQLTQVVQELAAIENPPGRLLTMVDVDEAMWNYNPRSTGGHQGAFYKNPSTHSARGGTITRTLVSADHEGMARWIEDFVLKGYGFKQLEGDAKDLGIPQTPTIESVGPPGFPIDALSFRTGPFHDPQGDGTFGGLMWRIAKVAPPDAPTVDPQGPKPYEVETVWETPEIAEFQDTIEIPSDVPEVGSTYRARVRMKDATGRWSHWSAPVEFVAGSPSVPLPQQRSLRITEVMYHPREDADAEFVELKNVGPEAIDLRQVALAGGIQFRFAEGEVLDLGAGEIVLVVKDRAAFAAGRDISGMKIAGEFTGQLNNSGDRILLVWGANLTILDFNFSDTWRPRTDGHGPSLVIADPLAPAGTWSDPSAWKESAFDGGSPGLDETPPGGLRLPGDSTGDGRLTVSDGVSLLLQLFGHPGSPLCEGALDRGGNLTLLDWDGDGELGILDGIALLAHLFQDGPPHVLGSRCIPVAGCVDACRG